MLAVSLVGSVVLAVALLMLVGDRPSPDPGARITSSGPVLPALLAGEWSGEGAVTRCAGLEGEDCSGTLPITLTIDCARNPCAVTPFDPRYGAPTLRFEDGTYRAAGPVPPELAPLCGGVPASSALWRLALTVREGRLEGRYSESTLQGFDCGATGAEWDVTLDRT